MTSTLFEAKQWFANPENPIEIEVKMMGELYGEIKQRDNWLVEPGTMLKMELTRDPDTNIPILTLQFRPDDPFGLA